MTHHITAATSVDQASGNAFEAVTLAPDTLIVDRDAHLASFSNGDGATLTGTWTVVLKGKIRALGGAPANFGLNIVSHNPFDTTKITIGRHGLLFGYQGLVSNEPTTLTNFGKIVPIAFSIVITAEAHITNAGTLSGPIALSTDNDTFTDFKKVGKVIKSGTVSSLIDLGDGADHFFGGAHAEIVFDGGGADVYKFGGGNDFYGAVKAGGGAADGPDLVNGGNGKDLYSADNASFTVLINLDTKAHGGLDAHSAQGADVGELGNADKVIGFENATGGSAADALYGSGAANVLSGGSGADELHGLGGRDILTGGDDGDTFFFAKLSDSGVTASTRDVITDFYPSRDHIDLTGLEAHVHHHFSFSLPGHHAGRLTEKIVGEKSFVFLDANGDGKADFSILVKGHVELHDSDFIL